MQAALDGLGHRVPPLLGEVFSHLGIDGRGEGRITAIDAIDLRRPEVAVIGHAPAPVAYLGQTLGLAQYGLVAAQRLLGLLVLLVVLDDGDEVVGIALGDPCTRATVRVVQMISPPLCR
jgi:hypothetical protein